MSLYAVKNDEGKFYDFYSNGDFWKQALCHMPYTLSENEAQDVAHDYGGHVVKLVEAPAKVVVSEEEAEMLKKAKTTLNPMHVLWMNELVHNGDSDGQIRIMHAYVNGWTVEKPKRYGVWVPHVTGKMYFKDGRGNDGLDIASADCLNESNQQFTLAEIEHYGLQDCERVEVTDDEQ